MGSGDNAGVTGIQPGTDRRMTKLLIEKGLITEAEFMEKLSAERAGYQGMCRKLVRVFR